MNEYDRFARLYDLEHRDLEDDVAFYRQLAQRCDGPVLELGCGSGRVALALAQDGVEVTGIDSSPAMLALARAYVAERGLAAQVRLHEADVRTFQPEPRHALVIYPLNGFLHLLTTQDQLAALCNVRRALLPGGVLVLDLPNPHVAFAPATDGQMLLRRRFRSPEGHDVASYTVARTDLASQRQHLTLLYDEVGAGGDVRRTTVETELRFVYRYEMALLLERAGLAVDAVYGGYDLEPYEMDSEIMLFVAYRPQVPEP